MNTLSPQRGSHSGPFEGDSEEFGKNQKNCKWKNTRDLSILSSRDLSEANGNYNVNIQHTSSFGSEYTDSIRRLFLVADSDACLVFGIRH